MCEGNQLCVRKPHESRNGNENDSLKNFLVLIVTLRNPSDCGSTKKVTRTQCFLNRWCCASLATFPDLSCVGVLSVDSQTVGGHGLFFLPSC